MSAIHAHPRLVRGHQTIPCKKKDAPAKQHGTTRKVPTSSKNTDKATFYYPVEVRVMPAPTSRLPEDREFVVDSGASMHMLRKMDLSSADMDTLRRSRNPTAVVTANGEVQTNEESQVYVHDLDLFVTVQLLEDTLAVLSLGKRCEENGYSYEWSSGQKPRLIKNGKEFLCKTENVVPLVVPGLSSDSRTSSSSTSTPQDSSSISSSPATPRSDEKHRETDCEGWRGSQKISKKWNRLCPHTILKIQIRNYLRKWYPNQGITVFKLTSQKTEIATYV